MEVKGVVLFIDPVKSSGEGDKKFDSIVLALDTSQDLNGTWMENYMGFQAVQKKCELLDSINIGDEVLVTYGIRANTKAKEGMAATEKNPKGLQIFTNLQMNKIELIKKASPTPKVEEDQPF